MNTEVSDSFLHRHQLLGLVINDSRGSKSRTHIAAMYWILERYNAGKGYAWPGYGYIAKNGNMDRTSAIRAVNLLEQLGYLTIERAEGGRASNRYTPNFDLIHMGSSVDATSGACATGSADATTAVADTQLGSGVDATSAVAHMQPDSSFYSSEEPGYEAGLTKEEEKTERRAAQADAPGGAPTHALKKRAAKAAAPNGASSLASKKASRDLFEAFIAVYPDDAGRDDWAWKAYSKAISQGVSHEQIMARVADATGYPGSWLKTLYSGSTPTTPETAMKPVEAPPVVEDEPILDAPATDPWDGVCIVRNATCANEIGAVVNVVGERAPAVVTHRSGDFYGVLFRDGRRTTTLSDHISLARGEAA
ncbi:helix-turn-helix domain-containing protein [Caenispirillum bisanense]|uniref:Helix-turn-helix domain-containing protein n=1 Tax=Caenispirillum bisanense TaxID=414052 RepID=A0A286GM44_9PROT|nr:helix-turn-helix domain-containing protein [Caenispirillum bisanense]SOD96615.1 Helix-turn-helix domain-containing protein [Caenispirillum bisanense]